METTPDEEKLKVISNEQTNNKLMYNLNVFEKYSNEVIPDKTLLMLMLFRILELKVLILKYQ